MESAYEWYKQLQKPFWAPPAFLFGPVWAILYILIAISFGKVFILAYQKQIPFLVFLPFLLNLLFNAAFTPIQFGLRNNVLALFDVVFVLITLIWAMIAIFPYVSWVTYMQIPYVVWVAFASALQIVITRLNYPR